SITLLAEEQDEIIGFMMGVIRNHAVGKYGYIKLMAVKSDRRREGIATKLFEIIMNKFTAEKCERVRIYESHPNYFMPGIDPRYTEAVCFAERRGFKKFGDTSNLLCDLTLQNFDTKKEEDELVNYGLTIKRADLDDKEKTLSFIKQYWEAWIPEVSNQFRNEPISLHICLKDNHVIGFSGYDGNNLNIGWFGPMGTDPNYRGKSIGGVLLKRCLKDQKEQGHQFAIIPWVGPIPFYMHHCNAKVHRVFWRYEKILEH
ncbi:MAG: GNAT family N-acetyltransferase, partial [Ignavibacteria bacterium]|nr:GNAT family N-acetyltransferase [Ignavibacteria bacterium]